MGVLLLGNHLNFVIQENEIFISVILSFSVSEPFQRPHLYDLHDDDDTAGIFLETLEFSVKNDQLGELVTYLFLTFTYLIHSNPRLP